MSSAGQGAIRQFKRTVNSQLIIHCAYPSEKGVRYLSVDLLFSERVLVGRAKARFRFDTGPVHEREIGAGSGNQFPLLVGLGSDESKTSFHEFKTSKKLRTQVKLPWAGDTVIEFDTSGASEALNTMPCKER